jgi:hypothetical protein
MTGVDESQQSVELVRRKSRRRRQRGRLGRLLADGWPEAAVVLAISLGVLLVVARAGVWRAAEGWFRQTLRSIGRLGPASIDWLTGLAGRLTVSSLLGAFLLAVAAYVLVRRVRWRVMTSPRYTTRECPRCGGELHRVHRTRLDRALNLLVPVRRFRCRNRECRWEGLRVGSSRHS